MTGERGEVRQRPWAEWMSVKPRGKLARARPWARMATNARRVMRHCSFCIPPLALDLAAPPLTPDSGGA
eukprot:4932855-Prymnesium_polylepis.1